MDDPIIRMDDDQHIYIYIYMHVCVGGSQPRALSANSGKFAGLAAGGGRSCSEEDRRVIAPEHTGLCKNVGSRSLGMDDPIFNI